MSKGKVTRIGPELPPGLGENVNGGKSVADPTSTFHESGGLGGDGLSAEARNPAKVGLDADGNIVTDAPPVEAPKPRVMRPVTMAEGTRIDPNTNTVLPGIYKTRRVVRGAGDRDVVVESIRQDF